MIALDDRPELADRARSVATQVSREGLEVVEAETARGGTVVTPESSWTGESSWSGSYLSLTNWRRAATIGLGSSTQERVIEPVLWQVEKGTATTPRSAWNTGRRPLDLLTSTVGAQGITEASGALLPQKLRRTVPASATTIDVRGLTGETKLDALLVRPVVSRLVLEGDGGRTELLRNSTATARSTTLEGSGTLRVYSADGMLVSEQTAAGAVTVPVPAEGFAVLIG